MQTDKTVDLVFPSLLKTLKDVSLLQLGEATHGGAEFYQLKGSLVRLLHQKAGFSCLLTESGFLETCLAGLETPRVPAATLLDETFFPNFCWRETLPLFTYLAATPRLTFLGVDPQFSSNEVPAVVERTIKPYDPTLGAELHKRLGECYQLFGLARDPVAYLKVQREYFAWLDEVQKKLEKLSPKKADVARFDVLKRGLRVLKLYWDFPPDKLFTPERNVLRDRLMAENAEWLLARFAPKGKAIFWAHNGHIGKVPWYRTTGQALAEKRGKRSYSLGLLALQGRFYNHVTRAVEPWGAVPEGLEALLAPQKHGAAFYDFRALSATDRTKFGEPRKAFEPENGGNFAFTPTERFDGVIVIKQLSAPTKR